MKMQEIVDKTVIHSSSIYGPCNSKWTHCSNEELPLLGVTESVFDKDMTEYSIFL